jgi:hypothetical protein
LAALRFAAGPLLGFLGVIIKKRRKMNFYNRHCKRSAKAQVRLARQRAFIHIIDRLAAHRGGKTFMVDTTNLKVDPPYLQVTERFSRTKLAYAKEVAALISFDRRKMTIEIINDQITYLIY